jgi:nucleoside-diphosphate-sugar epimerase
MILGYGYRDHGERLLTEDDPFGQPARDDCDPHVAAMLSTEQQAFRAPEGLALRYGLMYGGEVEQMGTLLSRRALPVANGGMLGWVHHEDAATATVAALEHGRSRSAYNIVDDLPASWREVFIAMADALNAPRPPQVPGWVLRIRAPYIASFAVGTSMRVSNARAREELGWRPTFRSYKDGIRAMRSDSALPRFESVR